MYDSSSPQTSVPLVSSMSTYGKPRPEQKRVSHLASIIRWLQTKKYQYEVTLPLYMLTPVERVIFNVTLLTLVSMLIIAVVFYLPNHVSVIRNRIWYYVEGSNVSSTIVDAVKTTKAALTYQTPAAVQQTAGSMLREL